MSRKFNFKFIKTMTLFHFSLIYIKLDIMWPKILRNLLEKKKNENDKFVRKNNLSIL